MNLYNLIEYSDNYGDTTASLYQYKRPEQPKTNTSLGDITAKNSSSFKYQSSLIGINSTPVAANVNPDIPRAHRLCSNAKIVVPLKYIGNFFRSLQLPLINTKLYIELNWNKDSIISDNVGVTAFQITKTELYATVVTLITDNNKKLTDLLKKRFRRSVFWNKYKSKIQTIQAGHANKNIGSKRILLDSSHQEANRLFLMSFDNAPVQRNNHRQYFLPRVNIRDSNVLIDERKIGLIDLVKEV